MNNNPYNYTNLMNGELGIRYKETMMQILSKIIPELKPFELEEAIDYSINKRRNNIPVKIHNNRNDKYLDTTVEDLADQLLNDKAIMTTYGILFLKHGVVKNTFYNYIEYLLNKRAEAKEEMKLHEKGSDEYNRLNLLQGNYKVACNSLYGCAGQFSSIFYNLYICTAITAQAKGCISASILMFESFLSDNVKFGSLTEVLTYLNFICLDCKSNKYNDYLILDRDITPEECFLRVFKNCGYNSWVPSDEAVKCIWDTIHNMNQHELNVVYYTNNLYEFCDNKKINELIVHILIDLEEPFLNPYKPPENIRSYLSELLDLMKYYVYYPHIYIDKLDRVYTMMRDTILLTDTDSCIVSLNQWYEYVLKFTVGMSLKIKYTRAERMEKAKEVINIYKKTEMDSEYDFYNKELVEKKRLLFPAVIIEEDNLRFSIINIMSYILGQLILDYMDIFSQQYNSKGDNLPRYLIMKNEYLMKSMLLTMGKKNYASIQLLQEGNLIPYDKQFDMKGLTISKIGMPKAIADTLSDLLEYDVLRRDFVDQVDLIKKFAVLEKEIYNSIISGSKEYHKMARIKAMNFYEKPFSQQGIKGAYAYNMIRDSTEEAINLEERNTVLVIKTDITKKNIDRIIKDYPDQYLRMKEVLELPEYKEKINCISLPINIEIPKWVIPFIDYVPIIHDNLRNFPFQELGISKLDSKEVTHSNILTL